MTDVTQTLARFAVDTSVPAAARHAGRRTVLNALALGIGANDHPAVQRVRTVLAGFGGTGRATVLGQPERLPGPWAAMVNGAAIHVEDFDDTHLATIVHPGAPIVPAALAAAELLDASTAAFLDAVSVGTEVALRVAAGLCPPHFDRGWHPTGTVGVIGAAVAAARVHGFDEEQMRTVIGLAGTQSAGLLSQLGTMTKSLHPGKAASDGLEAALLVAGGFTAPRSIVEGRRGLSQVVGYGADPSPTLDQLGSRWELEANTFKPYACGIVSHAVIDAARELHERAGDDAEWEGLSVRVNPVVPQVMGVADPADGLASKFSVYHCVALGLAGLDGGPGSFTSAAARDERLAALRRRVRVETDPTIHRDEAIVTGVTGDGTRHEVHVQHATGSAARPLTDDQLAAKARAAVEPVLGAFAAEQLIDGCLTLADSALPVAGLTATTRPN